VARPVESRPGVRRRDPTIADQILKAAKRVLLRDGYGALSFAAVAREAGVYTTAVPYYFGNRYGLITALVDSLAPKAFLDGVAEKVSHLAPGRDSIEMQMQAWREMAANREMSQVLVEILPHVIRDPRLRETVGMMYRSYRDYDVGLFGAPPIASAAKVRALASILIAVDDGLAIHGVLDPDDVDFDTCYTVLADLMDSYLERLRSESSSLE
jgi:AcrR family transcriptional regulator